MVLKYADGPHCPHCGAHTGRAVFDFLKDEE